MTLDSGVIRTEDGITWLRGQDADRPSVSGRARAAVLGIPAAELTPNVRAAIAALSRELAELRGELHHRRAHIARLEKLADEDALVPVANRRAFMRELSRMVSAARRYRTPVTVLYLDIDGMKHVNDTHGHGAGDAVIVHVATVLLANLRGSDVVGRLGGDEFGVVLANASAGSARAKARQLASAVAAAPVRFGDRRIAARVSYGVHAFDRGDDAEAMIASADHAMYARRLRQRASHS